MSCTYMECSSVKNCLLQICQNVPEFSSICVSNTAELMLGLLCVKYLPQWTVLCFIVFPHWMIKHLCVLFHLLLCTSFFHFNKGTSKNLHVNFRIRFCSLISIDIYLWTFFCHSFSLISNGFRVCVVSCSFQKTKIGSNFMTREKRCKNLLFLGCFSPVTKDFNPCSVADNSIWQSSKAL